MSATSTTASKNDVVRVEILRYLYAVHNNAKGVKGISVSISDFKKAMKAKNFKQHEVVPNLDYLIQAKFVIKEDEPYTFTTKTGRVLTMHKISYKISNKGIDYFEGQSIFQSEDNSPSINVNNINGVTVVGQGNYVYNQYSSLYRSLDTLTQQFFLSDALSDADKLHIWAEIQTIKSQLSKPDPDKSTVRKAWDKIKTVGQGIGIVTGLAKVGELLLSILNI